MKKPSPVSLLLFALTLSACAAEPKPTETEAVSPTAAPVLPVATPVAPAVVSAPAATPEVEYGKDGLPVGNGTIRFSLIEFSVPEKAALDLALLAVDEGRAEADGMGGALYEALLRSARAGETGVRVTSGRLTNGQASMFKSATLYRYPESYSQIQAQVAGVGSPEPADSPEKKKEAAMPVVVPQIELGFPMKSRVGPGYAITAGTPQDFTVQEVGIVMEVTPVSHEDRRTIDLDLKPKRTSIEAMAGETAESGTEYPAQPRFSVWSADQKITVKRGATTWLATIPPAPMSKENRTTYLFVRVD